VSSTIIATRSTPMIAEAEPRDLDPAGVGIGDRTDSCAALIPVPAEKPS